jgi:hypothetical protein
MRFIRLYVHSTYIALSLLKAHAVQQSLSDPSNCLFPLPSSVAVAITMSPGALLLLYFRFDDHVRTVAQGRVAPFIKSYPFFTCIECGPEPNITSETLLER